MANLREQADMSEAIALVVEPDRPCSRCGVVKPATAFHRMGPGKRRSDCAECRADRRPSREGQERQRSDYEKAQQRWRNLQRLYGITRDQYEALMFHQDGLCAACGQPPSGTRPLAVDHCHQTGRVRALVCAGCNIQIGAYETSRERVEAFLAKYGDGHPLLGY